MPVKGTLYKLTGKNLTKCSNPSAAWINDLGHKYTILFM